MKKMNKTYPLFLITETPMHAGSGDNLGIVDLPIQRERHTQFPKIEASSLKGSLREHFEKEKKDTLELKHAFGPENPQANEAHAGAVSFSDARLLLFPVKSMKGVFAWITCPRILSQLAIDLNIVNNKMMTDKHLKIEEKNVCYTNSKALEIKGKIVLEEFTFEIKGQVDYQIENTPIGKWLAENLFSEDVTTYWKEKIETDIVILSDDDFTDFVNLATEVITRTKIDNNTGTVEKGALWTEEYLPSESILYSLVHFGKVFSQKDAKNKPDEAEIKDFVKRYISDNPRFQIGGNATLGKGVTKAVLISKQ